MSACDGCGGPTLSREWKSSWGFEGHCALCVLESVGPDHPALAETSLLDDLEFQAHAKRSRRELRRRALTAATTRDVDGAGRSPFSAGELNLLAAALAGEGAVELLPRAGRRESLRTAILEAAARGPGHGGTSDRSPDERGPGPFRTDELASVFVAAALLDRDRRVTTPFDSGFSDRHHE